MKVCLHCQKWFKSLHFCMKVQRVVGDGLKDYRLTGDLDEQK